MPSKARAYLIQARADFDAYAATGEVVVPAIGEHHRLQLLQMALEKTAKAVLFHAEPKARYSHHVVVSAINRLRSVAIAEAAGIQPAILWRQLASAQPVFLQIEAASPSVGFDGRALTREESEHTANVEYPWQSNAGDPDSWIAPATRKFAIVLNLRSDPRSIAAVRLLRVIIKAADKVIV